MRGEVGRGHRQVDGVADGLVETLVRSGLEHVGLVLVPEVVIDVSELVVDGPQLLVGRADALLDPHVLLAVHVPGARVALHVAVSRLRQHRALPERLWQGREGDRLVEALRRLRHFHGVVRLFLERGVDVQAADAGEGLEQVVDRIPLLRPHVAEQVSGDRLASRHSLLAVLHRQLAARVAVQLLVERLHLPPEPCRLALEVRRGHVVVRAPHDAQIVEAEPARALVGKLDVAHVVGTERLRCRMPPRPRVQQLVVVAARFEHRLELGFVPARLRSLRAVLARTVFGLHPGEQPGELRAPGGIVRRRRRLAQHAELEQCERAPGRRAHRLSLELPCVLDRLAQVGEEALFRLGIQQLTVDVDVGRLRPACGVDLDRELRELAVHPRDELIGGFGPRRAGQDRQGKRAEHGAAQGSAHDRPLP